MDALGRPFQCAMQNVRQCRDEKLLDLAVALFGDLVERLALGLGAPDNAHNQGDKKNDAHDNSCGEEAGQGFVEMSPMMAPTPTSDQMPKAPRTKKNMMP